MTRLINTANTSLRAVRFCIQVHASDATISRSLQAYRFGTFRRFSALTGKAATIPFHHACRSERDGRSRSVLLASHQPKGLPSTGRVK